MSTNDKLVTFAAKVDEFWSCDAKKKSTFALPALKRDRSAFYAYLEERKISFIKASGNCLIIDKSMQVVDTRPAHTSNTVDAKSADVKSAEAKSTPAKSDGGKTMSFPKPLIVNEAVVGLFLSLTDLPIPVHDPQKIDYYLALMEPYLPGVTKQWQMFQMDVQAHGHIGGFQKHLSEVKTKTIDYLTAQQSKLPVSEKQNGVDGKGKVAVKELSRRPTSTAASTATAARTLKNVYQRECVNKTFLSIDVQEANYQAVAQLIPSMPATWALCVGQFTTSDFIKTCKYLRASWFGKSELRTEYEPILAARFIEPMRDHMRMKLQWEAVVVAKDELVYEVGVDQKQVSAMLQTVNDIVKCTGQAWHVQLFELNALGDRYPYFVKVHQYPTIRRQLKCVPMIHFRLAIRFDTQTPVQANDLYFMCTESKELSKLVEPTQFMITGTKKSDGQQQKQQCS